MFDIIGSCVPRDHARQVRSEYYVKELLERYKSPPEVLDLGCGIGGSVDTFRKHEPRVGWRGLDIRGSPEVVARKRNDVPFFFYDGVNIPFPESEFDIVYSHQAFEHVRYPNKLLKEVFRVLKIGGAFIGSVSSLEPYHSYSFWSFTPYGWYVLLEDAGLRPIEFRPGIDGRALLERQYLDKPKESKTWFEISPINEEIDTWAKKNDIGVVKMNRQKLRFCGHLVFYAIKPD